MSLLVVAKVYALPAGIASVLVVDSISTLLTVPSAFKMTGVPLGSVPEATKSATPPALLSPEAEPEAPASIINCTSSLRVSAGAKVTDTPSVAVKSVPNVNLDPLR